MELAKRIVLEIASASQRIVSAATEMPVAEGSGMSNHFPAQRTDEQLSRKTRQGKWTCVRTKRVRFANSKQIYIYNKDNRRHLEVARWIELRCQTRRDFVFAAT